MNTFIIYLAVAFDTMGICIRFAKENNTFTVFFDNDDWVADCINPDLLPLIKKYSFETLDEAEKKFCELCDTFHIEECKFTEAYNDLLEEMGISYYEETEAPIEIKGTVYPF